MDNSVISAKMTSFILRNVRNVAVKGAERASYKGTYEANVPESLQKEICKNSVKWIKRKNRGVEDLWTKHD